MRLDIKNFQGRFGSTESQKVLEDLYSVHHLVENFHQTGLDRLVADFLNIDYAEVLEIAPLILVSHTIFDFFLQQLLEHRVLSVLAFDQVG